MTGRADRHAATFVVNEAHDVGWLKDLGTVFIVSDRQDSGTICFGVRNDGERRSVKYAGARTIDRLWRFSVPEGALGPALESGAIPLAPRRCGASTPRDPN